MAQDMKGSLNKASMREKGNINGQMDKLMLVIESMEKRKDMECKYDPMA